MFIAVHEAVLAEQVETLLGADELSVHDLLVALATAGMVKHHRALRGQSGVFGITRRGLSAIDSDLPVPHVPSGAYQHDIDVVWIWLAVRAGSFGRFEQFLSLREMRSRDLAWARANPKAREAILGRRSPIAINHRSGFACRAPIRMSRRNWIIPTCCR
jgi:hypothetical protein